MLRTALFTLALASGAPCSAGVIDLRAASVEALDGGITFQLTDAGYTADIIAEGGVLNRTRSGFGVNAPGGGDDADAIDGAVGVEAVSIRFDAAVTLLAVEFSRLGAADEAWLHIGAARRVIGATSRLVLGVDLAAFDRLTLRFKSGNGFSLDRVHFAPPKPVVALSGPSALTLALAGMISAFWRRRRDSSKRHERPDDHHLGAT